MTDQPGIAALRGRAREGPFTARLPAQVEAVASKESATGKPYFELRLRDAQGSLTLRAWHDSQPFEACGSLAQGEAVLIEGEFFWNGGFGLDARRWTLSRMPEEMAGEFFSGGREAKERAEKALDEIRGFLASIHDPRLRALGESFLREHAGRFGRAAAARANHHARRGGLLEHTLQMLRAASALCEAYPHLNRDLLLAGTLLHDSGKLWETCPPEKGFDVPREPRGEMLGHIVIGIELVNTLWRSLDLAPWKELSPPSEDVRLHLLHLLASHHGQLEYGSPVEPKTPEAIALHHLDNLDAKLEMLSRAQEELPEVAPGIRDRVRALNIHPVKPLPKFSG
ncbi:MAG: HD domain-containing protein [Terrimicrobiaceae bacterium]|nr:HD domain-containing protein [Terrimicrobiaceae bacterium]